ncbi:hypothetical protein M427DRAFT_53356 [Gonapodya prolifera JEL478]|uniref:Sm domain-containing protein n=1 Tax=Gonapodya prolifera (strain JEL478) TaxID=1344416 RepID=A0A139AQE2_GONPJ|nr:hypothetical protein M427DRAFT_53356 [Gonapodya prolifera JEL478]|eukprot:KXS18874.1 hypothetical protein M427DRAFT_53356 [Gonapodya prolifera JEL478]
MADNNAAALPSDSQNVQRLRSFLGLKTRATVTDGRVMEGVFACTDRDCNIILAGTKEFTGSDERFVGMVMVPGKHLVKFEVATKDSESS